MNAARAVLGLIFLGLAGVSGAAQEVPVARTGRIVGTVVEAQSRTPIAGAEVVLSEAGRKTFADRDGRFAFMLLDAGTVRLKISSLGYADSEGSVEVEAGRVVEVEVILDVEPLSLDPITVTATRGDERLVLPGLKDIEARRSSGWGQFILEEDIQGRAPARVTDLLQGSTGVEVLANGQAILMRRTQCPPTVYIDDVRVTRCSVGSGPSRPGCNAFRESADAVNLLSPSEILAIEVYRGPAETPGAYLDSNSRCGVILIWTRRGGPVR